MGLVVTIGLLFDSGHMTLRGLVQCGGRDARQHVGRVSRPLQGRAAASQRMTRNRNWSFLEAVINGAFTVPGDGGRFRGR
jgi:inosose dehydratase